VTDWWSLVFNIFNSA